MTQRLAGRPSQHALPPMPTACATTTSTTRPSRASRCTSSTRSAAALRLRREAGAHLPRRRAGARRRRRDRHRHHAARRARPCGLRQRRRHPLSRPQRRLCRPHHRASERQHRGLPRGRGGRAATSRGAHHRGCPCLRGQLPADRRLRRQYRRPRLGRSGLEPARRRARRRQADEAFARPAGAGRQSRGERSHSARPDAGANPVRLEGHRRRRSRAQCRLRGDAGARRPDGPDADLRREVGLLRSSSRVRPNSMSARSAGAASRSWSTNAA